MPNKLANNTNINKLKINGKNFKPSLPVLLTNISFTKLYKNSAKT